MMVISSLKRPLGTASVRFLFPVRPEMIAVLFVRITGISSVFLLSSYLYCSNRRALHAMVSRCTAKSQQEPTCSSHTNFRYLTSPEKLDKMHEMSKNKKAAQVLYYHYLLLLLKLPYIRRWKLDVSSAK